MHRLKLLNMLENYFPQAREEVDFKQKIIDFIKQHPNCFERTLEIGHITASSWLLNKDCTKALLMHHTKLGQWFQLGGHCDGDPDVLSVAIKEAQEESGIQDIKPIFTEIFDIDVHLIPQNKKENTHYHYDIRFLLQVTKDIEVIQNHESKELRWFGKDINKMPTNARSVIRMFEKWLSL